MTSEHDLVVPALLILSKAPGGALKTGELRDAIKMAIHLSGEDEELLAGRSDTKIDQRVRNLKSHKSSIGNPIFEGWMEETYRGFRITEYGKRYLRQEGISG